MRSVISSKNVNIVRSATFEGMADERGFPKAEYKDLYEELAENGVRNIITGFMYISGSGRAMHPGQAGMDSIEKAEAFKEITAAVHKHGAKIIAQIAHTGRQTIKNGYRIVGASNRKSPYFNTRPEVLETSEIYDIIQQFADSAYYVKQAGFDGVQLHGAHGYLIHQFLLRTVNNREDEFKDGTLFLIKIIQEIRKKCGDFPIWIKISGGVDIERSTKQQFVRLIKTLNELRVDAIEVSYGTMDHALNIFRGKLPVKAIFKHNPIYNSKNIWWKIFVLPTLLMRLKPFTPMYNLKYAQLAKENTNIPIIVVGGFRCGQEILDSNMDYVSISRPLICEPDFIRKIEQDKGYRSKCIHCNLCAVMSDSKNSLKCYGGIDNNGR